jgi:serine/threonine protein kinase
VQTKSTGCDLDIERVELIDLEDAVYLEAGRLIQGAYLGNFMWRSPEANAKGPVGTMSDLFAFGIVVRGIFQAEEWTGLILLY